MFVASILMSGHWFWRWADHGPILMCEILLLFVFLHFTVKVAKRWWFQLTSPPRGGGGGDAIISSVFFLQGEGGSEEEEEEEKNLSLGS